jgi:hypothetical protein
VDAITAADLANAVTACAIIFAGLTALLLSALMGRQLRRWRVACWGIVAPWAFKHGRLQGAGLGSAGRRE